MWGDDLSCVCVSSGVPLPQIYWLVDGATEYYSAVSAENIVSIITVSIAGLGNLNATVCVSENLIGLAIMEIQVHSQAEKPKGRQNAIMCFTRTLHFCHSTHMSNICMTTIILGMASYTKIPFILLLFLSFLSKLVFFHPLDILHPFHCSKCHLCFLFDCRLTVRIL